MSRVCFDVWSDGSGALKPSDLFGEAHFYAKGDDDNKPQLGFRVSSVSKARCFACEFGYVLKFDTSSPVDLSGVIRQNGEYRYLRELDLRKDVGFVELEVRSDKNSLTIRTLKGEDLVSSTNYKISKVMK
ncbi:MAG: hypothetical protein COT74_12555 [Bdellovibrionales bacterium CG10_big_fil_rev_8_21_14_0_10_45_34]|nr:MAG: hypothetical protein COT74_12555 [Bdellovibrionales bacterium CG10_big_fil_rev_8_21_14_0_10_45_34]